MIVGAFCTHGGRFPGGSGAVGRVPGPPREGPNPTPVRAAALLRCGLVGYSGKKRADKARFDRSLLWLKVKTRKRQRWSAKAEEDWGW
jgi:hypothetical protein